MLSFKNGMFGRFLSILLNDGRGGENVKKKMSVFAFSCFLITVIVSGCGSVVDKPCDWCGKSPSVAYNTSDGSKSYVCKDCSKNCAICGKKATKHSENMLGMVIFMCDDCYKDAGGQVTYNK